jgi:hypothetical protein
MESDASNPLHSGAPLCADLIRASNNAAGRLDTRVKPAYDVHCEAEPLTLEFIMLRTRALGFHH